MVICVLVLSVYWAQLLPLLSKTVGDWLGLRCLVSNVPVSLSADSFRIGSKSNAQDISIGEGYHSRRPYRRTIKGIELNGAKRVISNAVLQPHNSLRTSAR